MRTLRRLIYGEVLSAFGFVTAGFLALFFFFDVVDELPEIGKPSPGGVYQLRHALAYVALRVPSHLYELMPIAVLIGTIFVMARLAQSSEYTILRTSGLGPARALRTLLVLGALFVSVTFAVGDYVVPLADRTGQLMKANFKGKITVGQTGAWLKEKRGNRTYAANIKAISGDGDMRDVRVFEFDEQGLLVSLTQAERGRVEPKEAAWTLEKVSRSLFSRPDDPAAKVVRTELPSFRLPTEISAEMVSVALLKPERMSTVDLFQYVQHLEANGQQAQSYKIEFWHKVFYPLSCIVMVVLALPFAYLHFRGGGITAYVFGGVMIGISFFLLNNVFGYIGNINNWAPWFAAAAPGMLYSLASLAAFGWLVIRQ